MMIRWDYLLIFENIAKHFERGNHIQLKTLPDLPQYAHIKTSLLSIQTNCMNVRRSDIIIK